MLVLGCERRPPKHLYHSESGTGETEPSKPSRAGNIPSLVPRPPETSLVKLVGKVYSLKCRWVETTNQFVLWKWWFCCLVVEKSCVLTKPLHHDLIPFSLSLAPISCLHSTVIYIKCPYYSVSKTLWRFPSIDYIYLSSKNTFSHNIHWSITWFSQCLKRFNKGFVLSKPLL